MLISVWHISSMFHRYLVFGEVFKPIWLSLESELRSYELRFLKLSQVPSRTVLCVVRAVASHRKVNSLVVFGCTAGTRYLGMAVGWPCGMLCPCMTPSRFLISSSPTASPNHYIMRRMPAHIESIFFSLFSPPHPPTVTHLSQQSETLSRERVFVCLVWMIKMYSLMCFRIKSVQMCTFGNIKESVVEKKKNLVWPAPMFVSLWNENLVSKLFYRRKSNF